MAAMFPPCAVTGPLLTIRKFTRRYSLEDLTTVGTLSAGVAVHLAEAIRTHQNVLGRLHVSLTDQAPYDQPINAAPGHHDIDSPAHLDPVKVLRFAPTPFGAYDLDRLSSSRGPAFM
jgi:hypothetical protein